MHDEQSKWLERIEVSTHCDINGITVMDYCVQLRKELAESKRVTEMMKAAVARAAKRVVRRINCGGCGVRIWYGQRVCPHCHYVMPAIPESSNGA